LPAELLGGASVSLRVEDTENARLLDGLHVAGSEVCSDDALEDWFAPVLASVRWRVVRKDMLYVLIDWK